MKRYAMVVRFADGRRDYNVLVELPEKDMDNEHPVGVELAGKSYWPGYEVEKTTDAYRIVKLANTAPELQLLYGCMQLLNDFDEGRWGGPMLDAEERRKSTLRVVDYLSAFFKGRV